MHCLVDYITSTLPVPTWNLASDRLIQRHVAGAVWRYFGKSTYKTLFPGDQQDGPTFPPYSHGWQDASTKSTIMHNPKLDHALLQCPGKACASITAVGMLDELLTKVADRCTRIDVAVDIVTDVSPDEFVSAGYSRRFSYASRTDSPQGESVYIGSPSSTRRAVVYRYHEPHPRSDRLRVEHRLKGDHAKHKCRQILEGGLEAAVAGLGGVFGWQHSLWALEDATDAPLPPRGVAAVSGAQVRWAMTQVFPALRRYEREGYIHDLRAFVEEHLFDESYGSSQGGNADGKSVE